MYKIYPSFSGWLFDSGVFTEYNGGCMRSILISANGIRSSIDPGYAELGEYNEERYEKTLTCDYQREYVLRKNLEGYDNVMYSGRIDFLTSIPRELKSVTSPNTRLAVIRKGVAKSGQLAQLVSYMIHMKSDKGLLVSSYYQKGDEEKGQDKYVLTEEAQFKIKIDNEGDIWYKVDRTLGEEKNKHKEFPTKPIKTIYNVKHQVGHQLLAAETLSKQIIQDRPINAYNDHSSPCRYCVYLEACNRFDAGDIKTLPDFLDSARECVKSYKPKEFFIQKFKEKKKK